MVSFMGTEPADLGAGSPGARVFHLAEWKIFGRPIFGADERSFQAESALITRVTV